ncbi:hypothetical protein MKK58_07985 [Methylobacterium sp. J-078]|uniref:hypothetical protein n=1 Tax=Methylobacterium sp. J-078 TaxID=2836657 RepID=UPI001FBA3B78|nr:hypothetical protein [Methylobacterium sp. J-078]MCJ2044471.1 hypothetical protein [Methylobacterium sp. J-078]
MNLAPDRLPVYLARDAAADDLWQSFYSIRSERQRMEPLERLEIYLSVCSFMVHAL